MTFEDIQYHVTLIRQHTYPIINKFTKEYLKSSEKPRRSAAKLEQVINFIGDPKLDDDADKILDVNCIGNKLASYTITDCLNPQRLLKLDKWITIMINSIKVDNTRLESAELNNYIDIFAAHAKEYDLLVVENIPIKLYNLLYYEIKNFFKKCIIYVINNIHETDDMQINVNIAKNMIKVLINVEQQIKHLRAEDSDINDSTLQASTLQTQLLTMLKARMLKTLDTSTPDYYKRWLQICPEILFIVGHNEYDLTVRTDAIIKLVRENPKYNNLVTMDGHGRLIYLLVRHLIDAKINRQIEFYIYDINETNLFWHQIFFPELISVDGLIIKMYHRPYDIFTSFMKNYAGGSNEIAAINPTEELNIETLEHSLIYLNFCGFGPSFNVMRRLNLLLGKSNTPNSIKILISFNTVQGSRPQIATLFGYYYNKSHDGLKCICTINPQGNYIVDDENITKRSDFRTILLTPQIIRKFRSDPDHYGINPYQDPDERHDMLPNIYYTIGKLNEQDSLLSYINCPKCQPDVDINICENEIKLEQTQKIKQQKIKQPKRKSDKQASKSDDLELYNDDEEVIRNRRYKDGKRRKRINVIDDVSSGGSPVYIKKYKLVKI
jgi:hypothetical protein